jgi:hypothetical protein
MQITRVFYDPAPADTKCEAPLPGLDGRGSATYTPHPAYVSKFDWNVPATLRAGATAHTKATITTTEPGGNSAAIAMKAPFEFGTNSGARQQIIASVPPGQTGTDTEEENYTFTPTRDFNSGEKMFLRIEFGCANVIYEYTAAAAPSACAATARSSAFAAACPEQASVPPKLGVPTIYNAPAPGAVGSYATPKITTRTRSLDGEIGFVDDAGNPVAGPSIEAIAAQTKTAAKLCYVLALGSSPAEQNANEKALGLSDPAFTRCVLTVARVLARADEIRKQKAGGRAAAAGGCLTRSLGPRAARTKLRVTCTRTAKGARIKIRARHGTLRRALGRHKLKLVVGRSSIPSGTGNPRLRVLWHAS